MPSSNQCSLLHRDNAPRRVILKCTVHAEPPHAQQATTISLQFLKYEGQLPDPSGAMSLLMSEHRLSSQFQLSSGHLWRRAPHMPHPADRILGSAS